MEDYDDEPELYPVEVLEQMGLIPFDVVCILSTEASLFGYMGEGELIGKYAQYIGAPLKQDDNTEVDLSGHVGFIVGHSHDRIVLDIVLDPEEESYLGWLNPEDYKIIHMHEGTEWLI